MPAPTERVLAAIERALEAERLLRWLLTTETSGEMLARVHDPRFDRWCSVLCRDLGVEHAIAEAQRADAAAAAEWVLAARVAGGEGVP